MSTSRLAVLGSALLLSVLMAGCGQHPDNGPVPAETGTETWAAPVKKGETFTDGTEVINLTGEEPATILRVESPAGTRGVKYLGAKVVGPHREMATVETDPGWPAKSIRGDTISDAEGAVIQPAKQTYNQQSYELLLGYKVIDPAYSVRPGIVLVYQVGSHIYQQTLHSIMVTCPLSMTQDACTNRALAK